MSSQQYKVEFACSYCRGTGVIESIPQSSSEKAIAICPKCSASMTVFIGEHRIEGRVEGESGSEVSKVVDTMLRSILENVSTLMESGHPEIGTALRNLTEAVAASREIPPSQQAEHLDQLEELSKQH